MIYFQSTEHLACICDVSAIRPSVFCLVGWSCTLFVTYQVRLQYSISNRACSMPAISLAFLVNWNVPHTLCFKHSLLVWHWPEWSRSIVPSETHQNSQHNIVRCMYRGSFCRSLCSICSGRMCGQSNWWQLVLIAKKVHDDHCHNCKRQGH